MYVPLRSKPEARCRHADKELMNRYLQILRSKQVAADAIFRHPGRTLWETRCVGLARPAVGAAKAATGPEREVVGKGREVGGRQEDRTPDLRIANAALSQLS